jgi:hypothetical protein
MLTRTSMFALAAIATIATSAFASTAASAAQVDFYLNRVHGGWDLSGGKHPPVRTFSVTHRRQHGI